MIFVSTPDPLETGLPEPEELRPKRRVSVGPHARERGGQIFLTNCTACHTFTGAGGALSSGKFAPALHDVTAEHIYAAMLTGPQNMPVFGDNQLTPEQKKQIITYI